MDLSHIHLAVTIFLGWLGQLEKNELVFKIIAINCSGTIIIINYNFHHVYLRTGPDFTSSFSQIRPFKMDLGRLWRMLSKIIGTYFQKKKFHQENICKFNKFAKSRTFYQIRMPIGTNNSIVYFCTVNGLLRILEKTSFQLICTRLKLPRLRLALWNGNSLNSNLIIPDFPHSKK